MNESLRRMILNTTLRSADIMLHTYLEGASPGHHTDEGDNIYSEAARSLSMALRYLQRASSHTGESRMYTLLAQSDLDDAMRLIRSAPRSISRQQLITSVRLVTDTMHDGDLAQSIKALFSASDTALDLSERH